MYVYVCVWGGVGRQSRLDSLLAARRSLRFVRSFFFIYRLFCPPPENATTATTNTITHKILTPQKKAGGDRETKLTQNEHKKKINARWHFLLQRRAHDFPFLSHQSPRHPIPTTQPTSPNQSRHPILTTVHQCSLSLSLSLSNYTLHFDIYAMLPLSLPTFTPTPTPTLTLAYILLLLLRCSGPLIPLLPVTFVTVNERQKHTYTHTHKFVHVYACFYYANF